MSSENENIEHSQGCSFDDLSSEYKKKLRSIAKRVIEYEKANTKLKADFDNYIKERSQIESNLLEENSLLKEDLQRSKETIENLSRLLSNLSQTTLNNTATNILEDNTLINENQEILNGKSKSIEQKLTEQKKSPTIDNKINNKTTIISSCSIGILDSNSATNLFSEANDEKTEKQVISPAKQQKGKKEPKLQQKQGSIINNNRANIANKSQISNNNNKKIKQINNNNTNNAGVRQYNINGLELHTQKRSTSIQRIGCSVCSGKICTPENCMCNCHKTNNSNTNNSNNKQTKNESLIITKSNESDYKTPSLLSSPNINIKDNEKEAENNEIKIDEKNEQQKNSSMFSLINGEYVSPESVEKIKNEKKRIQTIPPHSSITSVIEENLPDFSQFRPIRKYGDILTNSVPTDLNNDNKENSNYSIVNNNNEVNNNNKSNSISIIEEKTQNSIKIENEKKINSPYQDTNLQKARSILASFNNLSAQKSIDINNSINDDNSIVKIDSIKKKYSNSTTTTNNIIQSIQMIDPCINDHTFNEMLSNSLQKNISTIENISVKKEENIITGQNPQSQQQETKSIEKVNQLIKSKVESSPQIINLSQHSTIKKIISSNTSTKLEDNNNNKSNNNKMENKTKTDKSPNKEEFEEVSLNPEALTDEDPSNNNHIILPELNENINKAKPIYNAIEIPNSIKESLISDNVDDIYKTTQSLLSSLTSSSITSMNNNIVNGQNVNKINLSSQKNTNYYDVLRKFEKNAGRNNSTIFIFDSPNSLRASRVRIPGIDEKIEYDYNNTNNFIPNIQVYQQKETLKNILDKDLIKKKNTNEENYFEKGMYSYMYNDENNTNTNYNIANEETSDDLHATNYIANAYMNSDLSQYLSILESTQSNINQSSTNVTDSTTNSVIKKENQIETEESLNNTTIKNEEIAEKKEEALHIDPIPIDHNNKNNENIQMFNKFDNDNADVLGLLYTLNKPFKN